MNEQCQPRTILEDVLFERGLDAPQAIERLERGAEEIISGEDPECLRCTSDFLTEYFGIAAANKATDEQLREAFDKTVRLNEKAILENNNRLGFIQRETKQTEARLKRVREEGDQKGIDYYEPILKEGIRHLSTHQDIDSRLQAIHTAWATHLKEKQTSRLDMLLAIERFANLAHDSGPVLTEYACRCRPDTLSERIASELTNRTLKCLAEQ